MVLGFLLGVLAQNGPTFWNGKWDKVSIPPPVAPSTMEFLPQARVVVPIIFPVLGKPLWKEDYNEVRSGFRHTGIDIRAPKMTPIVAPFAGRINLKLHSFWIFGENGYRCLGTHLNSDTPGTNDNTDDRDFMFAPDILPGTRVFAGQFVGYVGTSGDATGPHLHFEIYDSQGVLNPFPSLKAASVVNSPKPFIPDAVAKPEGDRIRLYGAYRGGSLNPPQIRLALVSKQTSDGTISGYTTPSTVDILTETAQWRDVSRSGLEASTLLVVTCKPGRSAKGTSAWIATVVSK